MCLMITRNCISMEIMPKRLLSVKVNKKYWLFLIFIKTSTFGKSTIITIIRGAMITILVQDMIILKFNVRTKF